MKLDGKIKITGHVEVALWDSDIVPDYRTYLILDNNPKYYERLINRALVRRDTGDNLEVDTGLELIIDRLLGTSSASLTHCGVGSGTTNTDPAQTDLITPIERVAITDKYRVSSNELHADTFFSTSEGNGTWNESGLFTAASSGIMFCRKKLAAPFVKSSGNTATVIWAVTFTAVPDA